MTIAVSIFMIVLLAVFGLFDSHWRVSQKSDSSLQARRSMAEALALMGADLRSTSAVTTGSGASQLDLTITTPAGATGYVRWWLSSGNLVRSTLASPGGAVQTTRTVLAAMTTTAPFVYYDAASTDRTANAAAVTAPGCISRIQVTFSLVPATNITISRSEDVSLRAVVPDVGACP